MNSKIVGLVPARAGSKSIKNKNLSIIAGKTLLAHSLLKLRKAGVLDTYVSTDGTLIAKEARAYLAKIIKRPKSISEDSSSTEAAIKHAISKVQCDIVVVLQCTSPLLHHTHIQKAIDLLVDNDLDSVFTVTSSKDHDILLWDASLNPINYSPRNRKRRQTRKSEVFIETGGLYAFKKEAFIQDKCRICGKYEVIKIPFYQSLEIDDEEDLRYVKLIMEAKCYTDYQL